MLVLDCHNAEETRKSLSSILNMSRGEIDYFLDIFDFEANSTPYSEDQADKVFRNLKEQASINTEYDATCWFHFTRLPAGTDFSKGLQPLREALPDILNWFGSMVDGRVSQDSWQSFKASVMGGKIDSGTLKLRHDFPQQQGPFGWLVRDFAFRPSTKRDYFRRPPEAIEDLIAAIKKHLGIDLKSDYRECSNSFIVKFRTSDAPTKNLSAALYYLLMLRRGNGLSYECTTACSMHGQRVKPDDILKVEEFSDPSPLDQPV